MMQCDMIIANKRMPKHQSNVITQGNFQIVHSSLKPGFLSKLPGSGVEVLSVSLSVSSESERRPFLSLLLRSNNLALGIEQSALRQRLLLFFG